MRERLDQMDKALDNQELAVSRPKWMQDQEFVEDLVGNGVWRLKKQSCGRQSAPCGWIDHDHVSDILVKKMRFSRCEAAPEFYRHAGRGVSLELHMDDGHGLGTPQESRVFLKELGVHLLLKHAIVHTDVQNSNYTHLKREREIYPHGTMSRPNLAYFALLETLSLVDCKPVSLPHQKSECWEQAEELEDALVSVEHSRYRRGVGILMYVAHDRADSAWYTKDLSRDFGSAYRAVDGSTSPGRSLHEGHQTDGYVASERALWQ